MRGWWVGGLFISICFLGSIVRTFLKNIHNDHIACYKCGITKKIMADITWKSLWHSLSAIATFRLFVRGPATITVVLGASGAVLDTS